MGRGEPVRYSNKLLIFHFESLRCTSSSCYQFSAKRDWFRSEHCSSFSAKLIFRHCHSPHNCFHSSFFIYRWVVLTVQCRLFKVCFNTVCLNLFFFSLLTAPIHVIMLDCPPKCLGCHLKNDFLSSYVLLRCSANFEHIAQSYSPCVSFIKCPCLDF